VDLVATLSGRPVLNGADGLSIKADTPGAASWYYSLPRLPLNGTLRRDGKVLAVTGEAWLDREWGSGGLGPTQEGWDWYALQLSDGSALMFYALRQAGGRLDAHSAGTYVDPQGGVHVLHPGEVQISALSHWDSPRGGRYPARWRLDVPSQGLSLEINPALADQELPTQPRYWEGAVDATGRHAGQAVSAQGYVELVGYAQESTR
jgi:predicted secreted hydrolase